MTCAAAQVRQTFWPGGLDKGSMAAVIFRLRGRTRGGVWWDVVRRGVWMHMKSHACTGGKIFGATGACSETDPMHRL
ncbi:hypothetical protein GBA52_007260 [Prunus armeniaca]|nr:hypothetical protein GBA52_007260 [Prunus armeniaca]